MMHFSRILIALAMSVCSVTVFAAAPKAAPAVVTKKEVVVTMENKLINNHKVWIPSRTDIPVGSNVKIEIQNKLADPHGFEVVGYAKPVVVMPNTKMTVNFKAEKVGPIIYKCHMHPAHVGGILQVK